MKTWIENHPAPPLMKASARGPQWVGVPQHVLRLATIDANLGLRK